MRILSASDVRRALPMDAAIQAMREAFTQFADGRAIVPQRPVIDIGSDGASFLTMPGYAETTPALAVKAVGVWPKNPQKGLESIQGAVLALDPETGTPQALLEGAALTAIRTGAASGLATDLMARKDARVLAVFGAGVQARTQIEAVRAVRPIEEARVYAPTMSHAQQLVAELEGIEARVARSPKEALHGADIVCTATNAVMPVFSGTDLAEGVHVNAVGSHRPEVRELDDATISAMDRIVVDQRAAAWAEAGELIHAHEAGLLTPEGVHAELGDLCLGRAEGRADDGERTLFKSVGLAIQDVTAAAAAFQAAERLGIGTAVNLAA